MRTQKQNLVAAVAFALSSLLGSLLAHEAHAQFERDPAVMNAYKAGVALQEEGKWEEALPEFEKAIAGDDGTFTELYYARAESLRELEDYENAIGSYRAAAQSDDRFAKAYNGLGVCYRELGNLEFAMNAFRNAAELDRSDPEIAANIGDILVNNFQNPVEAMPYLDRAIEKNPKDAKAFRNRGWAHTLLREFEDGITDLTKAIELDSTDYETHQRLASVHLAEKDYQLGIVSLSHAIENYEPKKSSDPDTYINGYLLRADARMKLAKEDDQTSEQRSDIYQAIVEDTEAVLKEFPDRFPESGMAMHRRGIALRMRGKFAEAITSFTDAIQLIPAGNESNYTSEAYLVRGICWFHQGQNNLARGDFKEAAAKSLDDPLPYLWIGYTFAQEGNYRRAIDSYGDAASKNPAFALAHVNRGLAYMQLKDYNKAVDNFNEAIRAEPTEAKHFFKRGKAHELLGESQKALDSYQLALLRKRDYSDANRGAARALQSLGRPGLGNQYQNRINP